MREAKDTPLSICKKYNYLFQMIIISFLLLLFLFKHYIKLKLL